MQRILYCLASWCILFSACTTIPTPEKIVLQAYQPSEDFPLQSFRLPFSDSENWTLEGWKEDTESVVPAWITNGGKAQTTFNHGDVELYFECKLGATAELKINFQNAFPLSIYGNPNADTWGFVGETAPQHTAGRQPELWQTVQIKFSTAIQAGGQSFPPVLQSVRVNDILIHDQVQLDAGSQGEGPLILEALGAVTIRRMAIRRPNVGGATSNNNIVMPLMLDPELTYTYFERSKWSLLKEFKGASKVSNGTAKSINIKKHSQRADHYGLRYEGQFQVPNEGAYTFLLTSDDGSRMAIDGKELVVNDGTHAPVTKKGTVLLMPGIHTFVVDYFQGSGGASFRIDYTGKNLNSTPFYAPSPKAMKELADAEFLLEPGDYPVLQRGFLVYPPVQVLGFKETPKRRTHTVAVGDPGGRHFVVDAGQGTLLMLWAGEFANAVNMWEGRGNWQNLMPGGATIDRGGRPDFARLEQLQAAWPDSLPFGEVWQPAGYELSAEGWPTFRYQMADAEIEDAYQATPDGVRREVSVDKSMDYLIAAGESIELQGQGKYLVQGPGYILTLRNVKADQLFLRETQKGQELVARFGARGGSLTSILEW